MPVRNGEVDSARLVTSELHLEPLLRLRMLRKDDQPGGVLVDPMDDERTALAVGSETVLDQLVHRRHIRLALERHREEPRRLVDDDQIVVFVDNVELSRATSARTGLRAARPIDPEADDVADDEPAGRVGETDLPRIDIDLAFCESRRGGRARAQPPRRGEILVEPQACVVVTYGPLH